MKKLFKTISDYFLGVWSELNKVTWPTRADVISHTVVVIVSVAVAVAVISALDFGLTKLVQYIVENKS